MAGVECRLVDHRDAEFAQCARIRTAVFVEEQRVPAELEMDDEDATAIHVLAVVDGRAVGTARLILEEGARARIGRMAVLIEHRGTGVGRAMMDHLMRVAHERGVRSLHLAGQLHAIPFYERFGFAARGQVFIEAGIEHRMMDRALD